MLPRKVVGRWMLLGIWVRAYVSFEFSSSENSSRTNVHKNRKVGSTEKHKHVVQTTEMIQQSAAATIGWQEKRCRSASLEFDFEMTSKGTSVLV